MSSMLEQISVELTKILLELKDDHFERIHDRIAAFRHSIDEFSEFYFKYKRLQQLKQIHLSLVNQMLALQNAHSQLLDNLDDFASKQQVLSNHYSNIKTSLDNPKTCELFDFLSTAKNCSISRFAPAGFAAQVSIEPFKPPVPTEDMMRRSVLYSQRQEISKGTSMSRITDPQVMNIHSLQNDGIDKSVDKMLLIDLNP